MNRVSTDTRTVSVAVLARNVLLAVDFLVVASILLRWLLSGSTGLAEWIYHLNRIETAEQIPSAVASFVIFLCLLLAATACCVWLTGRRRTEPVSSVLVDETLPKAAH